MVLVGELLASCVEPSAYCDDTPASIFELPLVLAALAVLLAIGVASALGLRDRGARGTSQRRRRRREG